MGELMDESINGWMKKTTSHKGPKSGVISLECNLVFPGGLKNKLQRSMCVGQPCITKISNENGRHEFHLQRFIKALKSCVILFNEC